jgi:hypothetical protein
LQTTENSEGEAVWVLHGARPLIEGKSHLDCVRFSECAPEPFLFELPISLAMARRDKSDVASVFTIAANLFQNPAEAFRHTCPWDGVTDENED